MRLRKILAQEGLLKRAAISLDKTTIRRLNGGSTAIRKGIASILDSVPGTWVTSEEFPWGRAKVKQGFVKLISVGSAKDIIRALEGQGWKSGSARMDSHEGHLIYPSGMAAMNYGGLVLLSGFPGYGEGQVYAFNDIDLSAVNRLWDSMSKWKR